MRAEVDTGGHRVLHCDSRAVGPTATPIHVSTIIDEHRADPDRASSARQASFNGRNVPRDSNRRARKERQRRLEVRPARAETSDRRSGNSLAPDPDPISRVPNISEEEEPILDASDAELAARNRATAQPPHRGRREDEALTCLVYRGSSRTILEDLSKESRASVTWNRWTNDKSRLRKDGTAEGARLTAASANESLISSRRRSHQYRFCARSPRPFRCGWQDPDGNRPIGQPGGTSATTEGSILVSSQHSRARPNGKLCEDIERIAADAADARTNYSRRRWRRWRLRDGGPEEVPIGRIDQDDQDRRIKRGYRVRAFLQLAFLLFLVAFGRCGSLGSSSVFKFSARPTASGLSVLGIGAIVGAVSATPNDLIADAGTRAERSANLSHITGASRKIQMYIKNRHLQILPDGTVNGSNDDTSDYSEYA